MNSFGTKLYRYNRLAIGRYYSNKIIQTKQQPRKSVNYNKKRKSFNKKIRVNQQKNHICNKEDIPTIIQTVCCYIFYCLVIYMCLR